METVKYISGEIHRLSLLFWTFLYLGIKLSSKLSSYESCTTGQYEDNPRNWSEDEVSTWLQLTQDHYIHLPFSGNHLLRLTTKKFRDVVLHHNPKFTDTKTIDKIREDLLQLFTTWRDKEVCIKRFICPTKNFKLFYIRQIRLQKRQSLLHMVFLWNLTMTF